MDTKEFDNQLNQIAGIQEPIPEEKASNASGTNKVHPVQPVAVNQDKEIQNLSALYKDDRLVRLDFVNVCMDVDTKLGKKRILNNVSGYVNPGEILYIMGPSGGGKTSLLDFLTNRTNFSPESTVFFNKKKWSLAQFKKVAKYCKQHPQLYEVFTVEETLNFAASFFCDSAEEKKRRVDEVISYLGLEAQRNTKIGGLFFRGISGGQKQRVSVGEQLVANPSLLFLDEPTSGLDSASAYQLMDKLKKIAMDKKITIASSIHQPSQRIFDLSDKLIILAGGKQFGGNVAYFGPTRDLEKHFDELGIHNNTNSSMSEWILDEVNGDFGDPVNIKNIIDSYKSSKASIAMKESQKFAENTEQIQPYEFQGEYVKQSYFKDFLSLLRRNFLNNVKNPLSLGMRIITYAVMSIVIGSSWWQQGDEPKAGDVQNLSGVLFFMSSFMSMMSIAVLPIFLEDKQIMIKEKANGCYHLSASQIANFFVSLPFTLVLTVISGALCFFMVGFDNEDGKPFLEFLLNLFITLVASESLILCVGYMFSHLLVCIVLLAMIFGTFMVTNGFFIQTDDIPDYWIWVHYLAFNTYTFENFMHSTFDHITIGKDLDNTPPALYDFPGSQFLEDIGMEDINMGRNVGMVFMYIGLFRLYAYTWSYFKHTGKK